MKRKVRTDEDGNEDLRSFAYMLFCHDQGGPIYVKIGMSDSPLFRVLELKTGCPMNMDRLAIVRVWSREAAQSLEIDLHHAFKRWRLDGEWFRMSLADKNRFNATWKEVFQKYARPDWPMKWHQISVREFLSLRRRKAHGARNPASRWKPAPQQVNPIDLDA